MTVPTTTSSVIHIATGSDSVYPYTWGIASAADLIVYQQALTGAIALLGLNTDYTVSGAGIPTGGNITLIAGNLAAGVRLFIASDPQEIQALLLQQGSAYNPADVMAALDLLTRESQANRRLVTGAIQFPVAESLDGRSAVLPNAAARANLFLAFDSGGAPIVSNGGVTNSVVAATITRLTDTIATLKALTGMVDGDTYLVRGYYAAGDDGGGMFRFVAADASTANGGTIIAPTVGSGRWNRLTLSAPLTPKQFGAKGDGTTDDTAAFQACLSAVPTAGGEVHVNSGNYSISALLTCDNRPVNIRGDGISNAKITWTAAATTSGLSFTNNNSLQHIGIRDVSLLTKKTGAGAAIFNDRSGEVSGGVVQDRVSSRISIQDVVLRGATNNSTDGWQYGISLLNAMHSTVLNVHYTGYDAGNTANPLSEAFLFATGADAPTEVDCVNCWAFFCKSAVRVRGTVEGVAILNANFVAVNYGVDWDTDGTHPLLSLIGSHCAAYIGGVLLIDGSQSVISGNLFYHRSDATADGFGVHITNGPFNTVSNNVFVKTSGGGLVYKAVLVDGTADTCMVVDNLIQNANYGITFDTGTTNCVRSGNVWGSVPVHIVDTGGNNRKPNGYTSAMSLTADVTIPTATPTAMTWAHTLVDEIGAVNLGTHPTTFVIPAGVDFINVDGCVYWDTDVTNIRIIEIWKNGVILTGGSALTVPGVGLQFLSVSTAKLPVAAGDTIALYVVQNTGGNLKVLNVSSTYFRITVATRDD